jgi:hypothetical protein
LLARERKPPEAKSPNPSDPSKELNMSTGNENPDRHGEVFGYREALAEVIADLTACERRRLEAERAVQRARWQRRPALLDARGLALAA